MENFSLNQEKMLDYFSNKSSSAFSPFAQFEEIGKQNMALFTKAFSMFNPFETLNKAEEENEQQPVRKAAGSNKK